MSFKEALDELQGQLEQFGIRSTSLKGSTYGYDNKPYAQISYGGASYNKGIRDFCIVIRIEYAHTKNGAKPDLIGLVQDTEAIIAAIKEAGHFRLKFVRTAEDVRGDFVTTFEVLRLPASEGGK